MATPFARSLRSLANDGHRGWILSVVLVALLLGGWGAWFFGARVAVYETASRGRLESESDVFPVESAVAGRVVAVRVALGQFVTRGDVLLELDPAQPSLALEETRRRVASFRAQLDPLRAEIANAERGLADRETAARGAVGEARARVREAAAGAESAQSEAARLRQLAQAGGATEAQRVRAQLEAESHRSAVAAAASAVERVSGERAMEVSDLRTRMEELRREVARVEGEVQTGEATIARLEHDIAAHRVVAPSAGRIGDLARVAPGSIVTAGERIATIVPDVGVRAVAEFPAALALGRIRPGQRASIRLHGFSWIRFGTLRARVARVGSEAHDGLVRVELNLDPLQETEIPLEHGLPGNVEIEVDRVTPFELVLRAGGRSTASGATRGVDR